MSVVLAVTVGALFASGTYLLLQRSLTRLILGLALYAHGANLLLVGAGGRAGDAPLVGRFGAEPADPLPQALALTAIVIAFASTAFLLALAYRSYRLEGSDDVEDDREDRRIAGEAAAGPDGDRTPHAAGPDGDRAPCAAPDDSGGGGGSS